MLIDWKICWIIILLHGHSELPTISSKPSPFATLPVWVAIATALYFGPRRARSTKATKCSHLACFLPNYLLKTLAMPLPSFTLQELKCSRPLASQPPKLKMWVSGTRKMNLSFPTQPKYSIVLLIWYIGGVAGQCNHWEGLEKKQQCNNTRKFQLFLLKNCITQCCPSQVPFGANCPQVEMPAHVASPK